MGQVNSNFLLNVENDFFPDNDISVFDNLFSQYEQVIFSSIITTFGLDLFIKDQLGGDVDTIHNVRTGTYKNDKNKTDYDNRGDYDKNAYHDRHENYGAAKREKRQEASENNGTIKDEYTEGNVVFSKSAPADSRASLDHVIAAKSIHDDKGRVLAGLNGPDLANDPMNLVFTNQSLNSSMQAKDIPAYIEAHPELPSSQKKKMLEHYEKSKKAYEKKLAKAYYLDPKNKQCQRFYIDTAKAAANRGLQMGVRQVVGFILTEVWFCVKKKVLEAGSQIQQKFTAIINGIKEGFSQALIKYKEIIQKFGSGLISGIVSSLTTTLCNIFFTTSKNITKIIRQSWSYIVEATRVIIFNPEDLWFCDRMTSGLKIIATGASAIMGVGIQEKVRASLTALPSELSDIISGFCGCFCTGVLTVTILFVIDNNPFDNYLNKIYDPIIRSYREQSRMFLAYCAELQQIDIGKLEKEIAVSQNFINKLSQIKNDNQLNDALIKVMNELKIESPWGDKTLDAFMQDSNSKLIFKI